MLHCSVCVLNLCNLNFKIYSCAASFNDDGDDDEEDDDDGMISFI